MIHEELTFLNPLKMRNAISYAPARNGMFTLSLNKEIKPISSTKNQLQWTINRPFYRYGGHLEFRGNYGMPWGQMRNN